jgi:epoxide hydrolase-like predicted phosphatase
VTIKAVFWDFGGVLMRTSDWGPRTHLAERFGKTMRELEEMVWGNDQNTGPQLGLVPAASMWQDIRRQLNLSEEELREFRHQFFGADRLDMNLVNWIRSLKGTYKIGLISNALSDLRDFLDQKLYISDLFDSMVISAEVGLIKPEPEIYRHALQTLHVLPDEALFVDDMLRNVEGARAVGMFAIQFQEPQKTRQLIVELLDGHSGNKT